MKIIIILILLATTTQATPPSERAKCLMMIESDRVSIFVNLIWDEAKRVEEIYKIPMALTIAQACLESGYGSSNLAKQQCNFFGLKNNHKYNSYASMRECFSHYGRTMTQKCYKNLKPYTLSDWYDALTCCGYASSKTYTSKLNSIIFKLNLDLLIYKH
jgi:flagellum-specific peptidoglycan hydrolase FlgJ